MSVLVNAAVNPGTVPAPSTAAAAFHRSLAGYAPSPVHRLDDVAADLGLGSVMLKDESNRFGLPAFKVLGASWATERALRERPDVTTLVAASAGNHGRAVARVARDRGLRARIFLPARALPARRDAIASEGAEVVIVDGTYEDAVAEAERADGLLIADVGDSGPAIDVIDGYATLFDEAAAQAEFDVLLVPVGVGSLAAAAARHGAATGKRVIGVEPVTAPCLTASLTAGEPTLVPTPGTSMAGLDCAEVSAGAWPSLHRGIHATVLVSDDETRRAMDELEERHGLRIGESGAAPLAALRSAAADLGLDEGSRVLLVATEGRTAEPAN